jgi:hypothetical protein
MGQGQMEDTSDNLVDAVKGNELHKAYSVDNRVVLHKVDRTEDVDPK